MFENTKEEKEKILNYFENKYECKIIGNNESGLKVIVSKRIDLNKDVFYLVKYELVDHFTYEKELFYHNEEDTFYQYLTNLMKNTKFEMVDYLHKRDIG